jgi:hypothetical protein
MAGRDARRHGYRRVSHGDILKVDGANPFATRLDYVFAAISDLHKAIGIDGRNIAARKPCLSFVVELQRTIPFVPEVVAHH